MQKNILLGFLMSGEKTGYQVKKSMENSTSFFFNTSLGSIYPAFRKLHEKGLVMLRQSVDGGRVKNYYSITPEGREVFLSWLKQKIKISKVREEVLLKIFFFSELPEKDRIQQISDHIRQLEEHMEALKAVKDQLKPLKTDPFMMRTLEFGVEHYSFLRKWHKRFLSDMEKGHE